MATRYTRDDGRQFEEHAEVGMIPVCRHCGEAVVRGRICDEWFAGDATVNRQQCPRWGSLSTEQKR